MEAYRRQTGESGISLPDPIAMAIALDPSLCTSSSKHFAAIEVSGQFTRGMLVVDRLGVAGDDRNRGVWSDVVARNNPALICWSIAPERWKAMLYQALSRQ